MKSGTPDEPGEGGMVSGKTDRGKRILVAGGGTGGHLFPGIAIARGLRARFDEVDILFVVGRKKMEKENGWIENLTEKRVVYSVNVKILKKGSVRRLAL